MPPKRDWLLLVIWGIIVLTVLYFTIHQFMALQRY